MWQSVSGVTTQQHTLKKLNHKLKADMRINAAKQEEKEKKDPILLFLTILLKTRFSSRRARASPRAHLHGGDDHASVHDELAQRRRALVAVPAVDHQQVTDVLELGDGEVGGQGRLLPFLLTHTHRSHSEIRVRLSHRVGSECRVTVVAVSAACGGRFTFPSIPTPQSAAWIMLTSFPPSPESATKNIQTLQFYKLLRT